MTVFYKKKSWEIIKDISRLSKKTSVEILGMELLLFPNVYPSHRFRTTNFLLSNIMRLVNGKVVCDMGCGMGIVGLYALIKGKARRVVQADINISAIQNAKANKKLYNIKNCVLNIYQSNCFDNIPHEIFDVVIFNIPFFSENRNIGSSIEFALYDPNFQSLKKFLLQLRQFSSFSTKIVIAFSSRGDVETLEYLFKYYDYDWKLWQVINKRQKYDNRLYLLKKL